jgi:hypothetical protein
MEGDPHQGALDDERVAEGSVERAGLEPFKAGPQGKKGRGGLLGLEAYQALDRADRVETDQLEQQLRGKRRSGQLGDREDALGHRSMLPCPTGPPRAQRN